MNRRNISGFTLIELMIALVLALLLGAMGVAIFAGSKEGFRVEQGLAEVHNGGRAALQFLRREVSMAGFPATNESLDAFVSGSVVEGGSGPDTLGVAYESATDCRGQASSGGVSRSLYRVESGSLVCVSLDSGGATVATTTLLPNVEDFQVLYGERITFDDSSPDHFVTADNVSDWSNVVAVELTFDVASALPLYDATGGDDGRYRATYQTSIPVRNRQRD